MRAAHKIHIQCVCVTCFNKHGAAPEHTLCSEHQLLFTGIEDILYRIYTNQTVGMNNSCWETLDAGVRVVVADWGCSRSQTSSQMV